MVGEPLVPPPTPSSRSRSPVWPQLASRPAKPAFGLVRFAQWPARNGSVFTPRSCVRAARACLVTAIVGLLAGCGGSEDDTQVFAREAVESYVADDSRYDAGDVHCTGNPKPWFVERQATVVICAVRRVRGGCDWFRVELVPLESRVTTRIRVEAPNAGCVLPS